MRPARQRRIQPVHRTTKVVEQPKVLEQPVPPRKERRVTKRMEEEIPVETEKFDDEDELDESSEDIPMEEQHEEMKEQLASTTLNKMRPNQELYEAIKERYQCLLKELWKNQSTLEEFNFSDEEKEILNTRVKLWLEYFVSTATFRKDNVNLFEYMDSFCDTQKFI